jgi:two-component system chemotaxis response regulator CheY
MRVLIVDDSSTMRRIISNVVQQIGISPDNIFQADDGKNAIKVLDSIDNNIDIILTDWNMPNMNGLQFVQYLRSNPLFKKIPIIMITTEGAKAEVITALKAGVNNYIVKPFPAETLKEKIYPFFK